MSRRDGVTVWARNEPGRTLPRLRAEVKIAAHPYEVMAVIQDAGGHPRWMHDCLESKTLRVAGDRVAYLYNKTDGPWPVADRDAILRAEWRELESGVIESRATSTSELGEPDSRGVVHMPHLEVVYRLTAQGEGTHVEYTLDADPGGNLPGWVVARTQREVPLHTLINLRRRVAETQGDYEDWLDRFDPRRD